MAAHGVYARRNAGHRQRQLTLASAACSDWDLMRVRFDGLRAAIALLRRRRPPLGAPAGAHDRAADAIVADVTAYLDGLAARIDAGEFDAKREEAAA